MLNAPAVAAAVVVASVMAGQVQAHLGAGIPGKLSPALQSDMAKRGMQRRQQTYNDQTWQSVTTPKEECTPYNYAATSTFPKAFPANWEIADIMPDDQEANDVWKQIQQQVKVPNIKPKGTPQGSSQGTTYDAGADPDCWWTSSKCVKPKIDQVPVDTYKCDEPHTWGYTFDDGPNCTHNAFYDFLKSKNQKATMFYIGSNVLNWPLQAQRGLTDGHQLAAHTWSHRYMTALNSSQVFAELFYTVKAIKWVTGVTVTAWRPPFGDVDDRVRAIAYGLGLETIIWTDDTNDWEVQPGGASPTESIKANYESIISKGKGPAAETGGVIVLTHEIQQATMTLAQEEYPAIADAYKNIVPVHTCQNKTTPYRETNIIYPDFNQYVAGNVMPSGIPSASDITAKSVASIEVGIQSSSSSQPSLKASVGPSKGANSDAGKDSSHSGASDVSAIATMGSAALAAVGGAAALFL